MMIVGIPKEIKLQEYRVAGAVSRTSTFALTNATLPCRAFSDGSHA